MRREYGIRTLLQALTAVMILAAPFAAADDEDDIRALLDRYAATEGDLEAQARLMRDDRIMIAGGVRQSDQARNLAVQVADRDHRSDMQGGEADWIVRFEDPVIRVYGDTAVASFIRLTNIYPPGQAPISQTPLWVTLVLVKERGNWGIAHTHVSPVGS
jgi:uncharacterized protein (TIGR02246 family)